VIRRASGAFPTLATRLILVLGLVGLAAAVAVVLGQSEQRLAGTNDVPAGTAGRTVLGGQTVCQAEVLFPDTAGVRFRATPGGSAGPPLDVWGSPSTGQPQFMHGSIPAGWRAGWVLVPTQTLRRATSGQVCIRNNGSPPIRLAGWVGQARFEYVRPGRESWWSTIPAIWQRFGVGKAGWEGSWTLVLALVLVLAAIAGGAWLMARPRIS
jgi:hypothetical protein